MLWLAFKAWNDRREVALHEADPSGIDSEPSGSSTRFFVRLHVWILQVILSFVCGGRRRINPRRFVAKQSSRGGA